MTKKIKLCGNFDNFSPFNQNLVLNEKKLENYWQVFTLKTEILTNFHLKTKILTSKIKLWGKFGPFFTQKMKFYQIFSIKPQDFDKFSPLNRNFDLYNPNFDINWQIFTWKTKILTSKIKLGGNFNNSIPKKLTSNKSMTNQVPIDQMFAIVTALPLLIYQFSNRSMDDRFHLFFQCVSVWVCVSGWHRRDPSYNFRKKKKKKLRKEIENASLSFFRPITVPTPLKTHNFVLKNL